MKYGSHPLNLFVRFILELIVLIVVGILGLKFSSGIEKYVFMIVGSVLLATIWGVFNVPEDSSRSGKAV